MSTEIEAGTLMQQIIGLSPYRRALAPLGPQIVRIALANHQLRAALDRVADARVKSPHGGAPLSRRALGPDAKLFLAFLEYVYFASPAFLASVGEGPQKSGEAHG